MKVRCPNCHKTSEIEHVERGRHVECVCAHRFALDDSTVVEDYSTIDAAPPEKIGPYRIERFVGRGGMGKVYKAVHPTLGIPVAVKTLLQEFASNEAFKERFIKSAKICAKLVHPNIVRVYDFGAANSELYLVLEYIGGGSTLDILNREGHLTTEKVAEIALAVCNGLIEAEKNGIVHRDIKPENIMRSADGVYKLSDLGLAKQDPKKNIPQVHTSQTVRFESLGTPQYMSPEQSLDAKNCDIRADIYSLGITMYQLITGKLPFEEADPKILKSLHLEKTPVVPSEIISSIPLDMDSIIMRCIQKNKTERYQTPLELKNDLQAFLDHEELPSLNSPPPEPELPSCMPRNLRRLRLIAAGVLALLAVSVSFFTISALVDKGDSVKSSTTATNDPVFEPANVPQRPLLELPPVQVPVESSVPETVVSAGDVTEKPELWNYALQFAQQAVEKSDSFDSAIRNLQTFTEDKNYGVRAVAEIKKLKDAREKALSLLMAELDEKAAPLLENKNYLGAALLYELHSGPLTSESTEYRVDMANIYRQMAAKEMERNMALGYLAQLAELLTNSRYADALKFYRNKELKRYFPDLEKTLVTLDEIPLLFARKMGEQAGQEEYIELLDGVVYASVKSVNPPAIVLQQKIAGNKGYIARQITIANVHPRELSRLLSFLPSEIRAVYMGGIAVKEKDLPRADMHYKQTGMLSEALLKITSDVRLKKNTGLFLNDFLTLWNEGTGGKQRFLPPAERIMGAAWKKEKAAELVPPLKKLMAKYSRLNVTGAYMDALHTLIAELEKITDAADETLLNQTGKDE